MQKRRNKNVCVDIALIKNPCTCSRDITMVFYGEVIATLG